MIDGDRRGGAAAPEGEEWFRRWFGPEYLALYPHRDREEAGQAVDLFLEQGGVGGDDRVLDLGCGAGRHLAALRERHVDAVGLDLSRPLLDRARAGVPGAVPLVRADMRRIPFRDGAFDGLTSFFTSFGYFRTREEDLRTLHEMRRVLRPAGRYLIDFLNAEQVRRGLVPEEEDTVQGRTVRQSREIRDGRVIKRIEIEPATPEGEAEVFHERVRLYQPEELLRLLRGVGLEPESRYGDYAGSEHGEGTPRFIVVGRAA